MIAVPSDVQWVSDDLGVFVVEGARCECGSGPHEQGRCQASWPEVPGEERYPPVAWAQYDKPCETCGGHGKDRWDGRQVVELCVPCDAPFTHRRCHKCGDTGKVVAARATIEVGPVLAGSDEWDGGGVAYDVEHLWLYDESSTGGVQLTLDPLPCPGRDFVVVVRKESQENVNSL